MTAKALLSCMNPETQVFKVLDWMVTNGQITVRDMFITLSINSPRDCICKLRRYGLEIESVPKRSASGKSYIVYRLKEGEMNG